MLQVLQEKINISLPLKAYYLQVQLYEDHAQLTLHQVVKTDSTEEKTASIVVYDKIIPIPNIYNSLYASIWSSLQMYNKNNIINCCEKHMASSDEDIVHITAFHCSLKDQEKGRCNIKNYIHDMVS